MHKDDRQLLYRLAQILGLPPNEALIEARIKELQEGVLVVMPERRFKWLLAEHDRARRDEELLDDQGIADALDMDVKTWRRVYTNDPSILVAGEHTRLPGRVRPRRRWHLGTVKELLQDRPAGQRLKKCEERPKSSRSP